MSLYWVSAPGLCCDGPESVIDPAGVQKRCETYPITESKTVMGRSATQIDDETEDDKADNGDDLD